MRGGAVSLPEIWHIARGSPTLRGTLPIYIQSDILRCMMNPVRALRSKAAITQSKLAERAGTSQPTIAAYERGSKSPTLNTLARLASASDLEVAIDFVPPLTREDRRSIHLHRAIGQRLAARPDEVLRRARRNLTIMRAQHRGARGLFDHWRILLRLPVQDLVDLLTDPRPWMRDLRQVTPFAGVLSTAERTEVYRAFARTAAAS